jgi:Transketolase, N-terminal subunit
MEEWNEKELEETAFRVRESIIQMSGNGGCFIGASLSCVDILVYLYKNFLNVNISNLKDPARDYLFLSKGHDVPALYGVFAEIGFIEKKRLLNHLSTNDYVYWHPNRNIPGVEFHSGSLGHLLSVAIGVAYDCKIRKRDNVIVVLLGDGELNEGSVWEAALVAAAYKLDNLIAVVDRNHFQANIRTEELIPLEPLERKFEAFGWDVTTCNGHDFEQLNEAFSNYSAYSKRPFVVIADTVRGKGLPSIEERADRWFCNFTPEEIKNLLIELETKQKSILTSETLMVR